MSKEIFAKYSIHIMILCITGGKGEVSPKGNLIFLLFPHISWYKTKKKRKNKLEVPKKGLHHEAIRMLGLKFTTLETQIQELG